MKKSAGLDGATAARAAEEVACGNLVNINLFGRGKRRTVVSLAPVDCSRLKVGNLVLARVEDSFDICDVRHVEDSRFLLENFNGRKFLVEQPDVVAVEFDGTLVEVDAVDKAAVRRAGSN